MTGWTIERVLLNPGEALRELCSVAALKHEHDKRVSELLEANNRYQQEARDARALQKTATAIKIDEGDVIAVSVRDSLSDKTAARIVAMAETAFPGHRCIVLDAGSEISIVHDEGANCG